MYFSPEFLALIFVLILLSFMYYVVRKGKGTLFDRFTDKFSIIGSIFVPVGIFLTYRVFSLQNEAMRRDATYKIIDRGWVGVNEKMVTYYKDCPRFINSLYFDWQKKVLGSEDQQTSEGDKWYAVNYLSILIFQAWEDFITSAKIDDTGYIVWMNNFLQWSNSKILRNNWIVLKGNFADTTQEFGDYLFYISSVYKPKNDAELNNLAKMVSESEKFKNIITKRFGPLS